ncbi:sensor histidine kinase [Chitinophaga vietnamensis]|uniref:sensor histidine kinase n=1 Tax=Chitinophaga vietnamensis TaxID=2593957 RepID=UPI0011788715|nr:histidine kinase [Chitinophaga vietnamensis]
MKRIILLKFFSLYLALCAVAQYHPKAPYDLVVITAMDSALLLPNCHYPRKANGEIPAVLRSISQNLAGSNPWPYLCIKGKNLMNKNVGAPYVHDYYAYDHYLLSPGENITFYAANITPENAGQFRYQVIRNFREIVAPSKAPEAFYKRIDTLEYNGRLPFACLGNYQQDSGNVMVEVYNVKDYTKRNGILVSWNKDYLPRLTGVEIMEASSLKPLALPSFASSISTVTGLPVSLRFHINTASHLILACNLHVPQGTQYGYILLKEDGKSFLKWEDNLIGSSLIVPTDFNVPGKYKLVVYPNGITRPLPDNNGVIRYEQNKVIELPIEILPPEITYHGWAPSSLQILAATLVAAFLFCVYYFYNQRKMKLLARDKQMAQWRLQSVRNQLNPHFIFNALTSIQNLVNRQDPRANHYLQIFSSLTRKVLDQHNEEMISLGDERQLLDEYLQMEQLRFNFHYEIQLPENLSSTEIPALLLQPYVENAVIHGASALGEKGFIHIQVKMTDKDLYLSIKDNGYGYTDKTSTTGRTSWGLKLGEERINLLNRMYRENVISCHVATGSSGTTVELLLKEWC